LHTFKNKFERTDGDTDGHTDGQTNGRTVRLYYAPTFIWGHKNKVIRDVILNFADVLNEHAVQFQHPCFLQYVT